MIPFPWGHRSQDPTSLNRPFPNRYENRLLPARLQSLRPVVCLEAPQPNVSIGRSYRKRR
jgi:hypothetical protein